MAKSKDNKPPWVKIVHLFFIVMSAYMAVMAYEQFLVPNYPDAIMYAGFSLLMFVEAHVPPFVLQNVPVKEILKQAIFPRSVKAAMAVLGVVMILIGVVAQLFSTF